MRQQKALPEQISICAPSLALRDSYVECVKDLISLDPARSRGFRWDWLENFDLYLENCARQAALKDAADGVPPAITYWIALDHLQAVGKLTLHPILTPRLAVLGGNIGFEIRPAFRRRGIAERACALGLQELQQLGLEKALATCDEDNLGSRRVLEKNGGRQIDRYDLPDWPKPVLKFEFALKTVG